jgi:D-galactarolactone cycloisomerase
LKVTGVKVVNLSWAYPEGEGIECAEGMTGSRVTSLVLVSTDEEVAGLGSAYSHPDLVRLVVERHLAPFLIGSDATDVEGLWDRMYSLTRWYGRKGAAISALGAVDVALWDIRGKAAGMPVYRLLGGGSRAVPGYASGLLWQDDLSALADEALAHARAGFGLVKMRLGRTPEYDRAAVDTVLGALDGTARVAVDGTHRYSLAEAVELGHFLADRGVAWFEEPFPPEDVDAYAALRSQVDVPIAAGENEFGLQGFRELIRAEAVDVAQPDVSRAGGITECRRIVELAAEHGVEIVTHTWSDAVALIANAHLVSSSKSGRAVEVDATGTPFIEQLTTGGSPVSGGEVQLSSAAGLGIELDREVVARLAVPEDETVRDGNYGDLLFGAQAHTVVPPRVREPEVASARPRKR